MLKEIFHYIYCMSIPSTIFVLILVCCLWYIITLKTQKMQQKKLWQIFNLLLFFVWFICVIYMTIFSRNSKTEMNLIPFHFVMDAIKTGNEEFFRTGWMNVLLFVPGGMWLSYGMVKSTRIKRFLSIVSFIIISIGIEIIQWYYKLGTVETDDVICNTLGAIIGVTAFIWAEKIIVFTKPYILNLYNLIKQKVKNLMI